MRLIDADALIKSINECIEAKDANYEWEQVQGLECALECIDEEPSVQSDVPDTNVGDMISRQMAIDSFRYDDDGTAWEMDDIVYRLEQMPSAQPEIIRCKECKHMVEHKHYGNLGESAYTCEGNMDGWILPDSFCSHAERREDG